MNNEYKIATARRAVELLHGGLQKQVHLEMAPYGPDKAYSELMSVANDSAATHSEKAEVSELLAKLREKFPRLGN